MFTKPTLANNRYELISTLGQGGMACVFKALDTRLKVEKAIKIPNHQCLTNKRIRDRFENEATTMAKLHHKNIVVVHDIQDEIYEDPAGIVSIKIVYMVMEMLPGGSLQDRIDTHGPLHPQQAIDAAIQMAEGLGYAHQNNVVHRDVKLDNVLIGSDNTLKVTDFGIAQIDGGSGMTQTGATMGTLAFMAPEQKLSSRRATALSDLYSVGASLYLMLTNRNPSELYAHDIQEVGFADLPEEVGIVLGKCCNLDPKERYQNAAELTQALKGIRTFFGDLPENSTPFFIPAQKKDMQPEDLARQERKVTSMWTTLLGIDPDELTGSIPRPKVTQPKVRANDTGLDFGTFDGLPDTDTNTALDVLGLDLTSDFEVQQDSNTLTEKLNQATPTMVAPPEYTDDDVQTSSSKGGIIAGMLSLLVVGGWVLMQNETEPISTEPQTIAAKVEPKVNSDITPAKEPVDNKMAAETNPEGPAKPEPEVVSAKKQAEKPVAVKPKPKTSTKKTTKNKPSTQKEPAPVKNDNQKAEVPPTPTTFGTFPVSSRPSYSHVFVKGKPANCQNKPNNFTPCKVVLPTGSNLIVLKHSQDQEEKSIRVNIVEGVNSAQCWDFANKANCNR